MPRLKPLTVTDDERAELEAWVRRPKTAQRLALWSRIVLAADGPPNTTIAADLRVTLPTVGKWRPRFPDQRLGGRTHEPRPGPPRTVTDAHVEDVVTRPLGTTPAHATHGSTRGMAEVTGLSQTAISRIWRAFGPPPHRHEAFKRSTDPYVVEKVRDVVGRYLDPPDRAVVLSVDETSGTQALDRTQLILPMPPITERRIRRGVFQTVTALEHAIEAYLAEHNANPKPFKWTATADLILRRVEDVCKRTLNSGH